MKQIDVLIVDDEPIARDILEEYIRQIPSLRLAGKCKNAIEAQSILGSTNVDLILVDINMPHISGIDFIRSIKHSPLFIFTTAYSEYAVQSYELNALDYLLKPISFERFFTAVTRAMSLAQDQRKPSMQEPASSLANENLMFVKANGKLIKIDLGKLWLIEGLKDYLKLYIDDEKIVTYSTMKNMESQLAFMPSFVRINKSNIINIKYITEIEGNAVMLKKQHFVIGPTYRDKVNKIIDNYKMI